jgi:DNA-3-methyladenine glycosylase
VFRRADLEGPVLAAAEALLGARLVREEPGEEPRVGRIVEVEAYGGPEDRASHARAGRTARTGPMFGPPGLAYVYRVYGMYDCLNVVTGPDGAAAAVLIRAVEPLGGIPGMRAARQRAALERGRPSPRSLPDARLAAGPGRLCDALGVGRWASDIDLCDGGAPLRLGPAHAEDRPTQPAWTPRIGIAHAGEPWASLPWRLVDRGSASLSGGR